MLSKAACTEFNFMTSSRKSNATVPLLGDGEKTAVDVEGLAVDVPAGFGSQQQHRSGQILWPPPPARRRPVADEIVERLVARHAEAGRDVTGRKRVYRHASAGQVGGESARERGNRPLGGDIGNKIRARDMRHDRADIDDPA